jgi:rod shape-determining protein MreC
MRDTRRTRLVLVLLLLVSLTLIALSGTSGPGQGLRSAAGSVFGPVQRAVASAYRPIHDFFRGLDGADRSRLDQLQQENDQLRAQANSDQYATSRAAELDNLLKIAGLGQYRVVPAQVIAIGPAQGFQWTAEIDAGSLDGLKVGMTVINGSGLVGRVKTVSRTVSTVLLAIDPSYQAGARIEASLSIGLVTGQGNEPMQFQLLQGNAAQLQSGERLVTWQNNGLPGGVPIGEIISVHGAVGSNARSGQLKPYVDFGSLDLVGVVVQIPRTDPRDSVLPPRPTPTPSGSSSPGASTSSSPGASPGASTGAAQSGSPGASPSGKP